MKTGRKAQSEILSFLLVALIVVILVLATYSWGSKILVERREAYAATRMKSKMLEIRDIVSAVLQDGSNSSRTIQVGIERGKLYLDTSFIPVSCGQQRTDNGIIYEIDTKEQVVSATSWTLVDPSENETGDLCTKGGPFENKPGILYARSAGGVGEGRYMTQYLISFRNLKDRESNQHHIVNISSSSVGDNTTGIGEGTHNIMIRNEGAVYDESNSRWTHNIAVIFDP
jgi:hypothetical protein